MTLAGPPRSHETELLRLFSHQCLEGEFSEVRTARSNTYERTVLNSAALGYCPDFLILGTELTDQGELYRAACCNAALQDRQQHTHHDMLDPHERRVSSCCAIL